MTEVKIIVNTPKNQAKKSVKTLRKTVLGFSLSDKVKEEKVLRHNKFHWIIYVEKESEMKKLVYKCAKADVTIKKFYRLLFKCIDKGNKIKKKSNKKFDWFKRFIVSRLRKQGYKDDDSMLKGITDMSEEDFNDFIDIGDRKAMDKLLAGDIVILESELPY